jgi:hypothetical protein
MVELSKFSSVAVEIVFFGIAPVKFAADGCDVEVVTVIVPLVSGIDV